MQAVIAAVEALIENSDVAMNGRYCHCCKKVVCCVDSVEIYVENVTRVVYC